MQYTTTPWPQTPAAPRESVEAALIKRVSRLKIATYNVRTLLKDEHVHELEEELMEARLVLDVIGIWECFTTLQIGHLQYHSKANNGQAGVDFLIYRKNKYHILRVNNLSPRIAERILYITKRYNLKIVYAPTTTNSVDDINSVYNDVGETLGKPNHYTVVMGDINAQIGKHKRAVLGLN